MSLRAAELEQVDGRRDTDGADHDRITDVAVYGQDQRADGADDHDREPGSSLKRHGYILAM